MREPYIVTVEQVFRDARTVDVREESLLFFHAALLRDLSSIVEGDLVVLESVQLNQDLAWRAQEVATRLNARIVSTVHDPIAGLSREMRVSRQVVLASGRCQEQPERVEVIPRAWRSSVEPASVVLVDDGQSGGASLIAVLNALESCGFRVVALVTAVLTAAVRRRIEASARADVVIVAMSEYRAISGWVRSGDFIPFAVDGGRELSGFEGAPVAAGRAAGGRALSVARDCVVRRCLPYLLPYVPDASTWAAWTGLPEGSAHDFSRRRLEDAFLFFSRVEARGVSRVTADDVGSVTRGQSVPFLGFGFVSGAPARDIDVMAHLDWALAVLGPGGNDRRKR